MIWKVVDRQRRPIALCCLPWLGEERFGGRTPAAHRLGDPLTLKRIDQTGGVADEEYPPFGRNGANHAHLEPTTQATRWHRNRRVGEELDLTQVLEEAWQGLLDLRSRLTIGHRTQTQSDVCSPGGSWKDPPVTGKPLPRRQIPKTRWPGDRRLAEGMSVSRNPTGPSWHRPCRPPPPPGSSRRPLQSRSRRAARSRRSTGNRRFVPSHSSGSTACPYTGVAPASTATSWSIESKTVRVTAVP